MRKLDIEVVLKLDVKGLEGTCKGGLGRVQATTTCTVASSWRAFLPFLNDKRHALLHYLTQPGAADQVEELKSLVSECWPVSLMDMD